MRILVIVNLYPPLHAGTFDFRCEAVCGLLRKRGHEIRILTSRYGLQNEQRDAEVERRLILNGGYDQPALTSFNGLKPVEEFNNAAVREAIAALQPDLIYVWSLTGLSKSIIFTLRHSRIPTVYDVADDWMQNGLGADPWLNWWNREKAPLGSSLWRSMLELTGKRDQLTSSAPTRMTKGYERVPELFGENRGEARPGSIGAFTFERLYFCSQALKEATQNAGFRVAHAEVIYPGIATDRFWADPKPASHVPQRYLIVSRLQAQSGVMTALQALKLARENKVQASLSIYGRGESEQVAQMRSYVIQHQLPVEFLTVSSQQKDLAQIYRQHDGFIYCAEWNEPFAVTPLEAMAAGLPVIAARSGGFQELLRAGENGWIYTPGDALELASRLQEVQMQPALRSQIVETAQAEVMTRFSESSMLDQIENYLQTSIEAWQNS